MGGWSSFRVSVIGGFKSHMQGAIILYTLQWFVSHATMQAVSIGTQLKYVLIKGRVLDTCNSQINTK